MQHSFCFVLSLENGILPEESEIFTIHTLACRDLIELNV